jgi:hypothetical protein
MQIKNSPSSLISNTFSNVVKQICITLTFLLFTSSMILFPLGTAHAAGDVKWHPGHYYLVTYGKENPSFMKKIYTEVAQTPALRGLVIRYDWAELESAEGVYNFSAIDARLAELAAQKKRLIILLRIRESDPDAVLVPNYLKDSKYEGGVFAFGKSGSTTIKGYNVKLWNDLVHDRLTTLIRALGKRYNSHAYFEGIGLTESAMGQPLEPVSSTEIERHYFNLLSINNKLRSNFPNTMTFQYLNYPRWILESFTNKFKETGTALGCPDIFIEEPGLWYPKKPKGLYNYYPELSGVIPLTVQVEDQNFENTRFDGTGYQPTVSELLKFGRDTLKVNYIFWKRVPEYYSQVLELLNWSAQTSDPAGGLNANCPSVFASCID